MPKPPNKEGQVKPAAVLRIAVYIPSFIALGAGLVAAGHGPWALAGSIVLILFLGAAFAGAAQNTISETNEGIPGKRWPFVIASKDDPRNDRLH